jgi:hypothetical protein
MRRAKNQRAEAAVTGTPLSGGVTNENYIDLAQRFIEAHGGEGFVIRSQTPRDSKRPTPAQWRAWMEYFSDRQIKTTFARQHSVVTVPTEWPEDFDFTAPLSDRLWTPLAPDEERPLTVEQRRANVARFRPLIANAFSELPNDHRKKSPLGHLAPVRAPIDFSAPLSVSDELKAFNEERNRYLRGVADDQK